MEVWEWRTVTYEHCLRCQADTRNLYVQCLFEPCAHGYEKPKLLPENELASIIYEDCYYARDFNGTLDLRLVLDYMRNELELDKDTRISIFKKLSIVDLLLTKKIRAINDSKNEMKQKAEQQRQALVKGRR